MSEDKVFLHYTKAELDRNYDQYGWAKNAAEIVACYARETQMARSSLAFHADLPYGSHVDETVDVFPASDGTGDVQVFVHGGAWKNFSKNDFSFIAKGYVPAGVHTVVANFTNLPASTMPKTIAQVRSAIMWTYRNISRFGGSPDRIFVTGQSAGAHLAACAAMTDWTAYGLPENLVKGAAVVSGSYDLRPVVLSARGDYVKLTEAEVMACSPMFNIEKLSCPVLTAYCDGDTDEFRRQSEEFTRRLAAASRLYDHLVVKNTNHFEVMLTMANPQSELFERILKFVRAA